jgi:hypothetical protein
MKELIDFIICAKENGLISHELASYYVRKIIEWNCIGNGFELSQVDLDDINKKGV